MVNQRNNKKEQGKYIINPPKLKNRSPNEIALSGQVQIYTNCQLTYFEFNAQNHIIYIINNSEHTKTKN